MTETVTKGDYSHLRADVPKRRTAYWAFLASAIVVFFVSIADILWLDSVLFWGVIAAYAILFIWAFVLLFSRSNREEYDEDFFDAPTSGVDWRNDGRVDHLRCAQCRHVFAFDMKHIDDDRAHVAFNCPECGATGKMPKPSTPVVEAVVPGGAMHGPRFTCYDCDEQWAVGAIGHEPKADVRFASCPHCKSDNIGRARGA